MENAVRDRVVMITGASSGIGAVTAQQIGAAGGTVALVARGSPLGSEQAARAVGNMAVVDAPSRVAICEAGGIPALTSLLREGSQEGRAVAARVLAMLREGGQRGSSGV